MNAAAERAYWDNAGPDEIAQLVPGDYNALADECAERLLAVLPTIGRALDLGCGPGRLTFCVAKARSTLDLIGVDISENKLNAAKFTRQLHRLERRVWFYACDGRNLPGFGTFDAAWCVLVFQHLPPDAVAGYISQVAERLVPGGVFVFQYVAGDGRQQGPLAWEHDTADVKAWCEDAGLSFEFECAIHESWAWITARKGSV